MCAPPPAKSTAPPKNESGLETLSQPVRLQTQWVIVGYVRMELMRGSNACIEHARASQNLPGGASGVGSGERASARHEAARGVRGKLDALSDGARDDGHSGHRVHQLL